MHDTLKDVERKVIPRWRRVADTPSEELSGAQNNKLVALDTSGEINEVLATFQGDKSIHHAIEAVYLFGICKDNSLLRAPAERVLSSRGLSTSVYDLARRILSDGDGSPNEPPNVEPNHLIPIIRAQLRENPRNALAHVELARSFASIGRGDKADKHFLVALQLAPNNRFVLRAAGRFFVHQKNERRAFKAMRNAARYDPWVAAASISIAHLAKLPMPRSREIVSFIDQIDNPAQTSELAAALATAELDAGNVKRARKLFRASAIAPTDNVVAQLEWASNRHGISFDERLLQADLAFEARAARHARSHEWEQVVDACDQWLADEPFSVRPAYEGGFVASELLQDFERAKSFVERGLIANPYDPGLLNNLAFHLIMMGDYDRAAKTVALARRSQTEEEDRVAIDATDGLLHYRTGSPETGAQLYQVAVQKAHKLGLRSTKQLAFMHFAYEEVRRGASFSAEDVRKIVALYEGPRVDSQTRLIYGRWLKPVLDAKCQIDAAVQRMVRDSLSSFRDDPLVVNSL